MEVVMLDEEEKILNRVGRFGKADLSVITSCKSRKQARHKMFANVPLLQNIFKMSYRIGTNNCTEGSLSLNEFHHTEMSQSQEEIISGLRKANKGAKIGYNETHDVYTVNLK